MKELLKNVRKHNILLEVVDGELNVYAGSANINPDLLAEIRKHKSELVQFLLENKHTLSPETDGHYIPSAALQEAYYVSSSQRGIWLSSQTADGNMAYNMPGFFRFEGPLNIGALKFAFERLLSRHEILRTVFRENEEGELRQYILNEAACPFDLSTTDLRNETHPGRALHAMIRLFSTQPFELDKGPLLKTCLYQLSADSYVLGVVMHHIISDGWSVGILMKELLAHYQAYLDKTLPSPEPLNLQYKDFAVFQQQQLANGAMQAHKLYWLEQLQGDLPVLDLKGDKPRPLYRTYNGATACCRLRPQVFHQIKAICRENNSTTFMGLLAVVNALLYRYTEQQDIIVGIPLSGRNSFQLESQLGLYTNILPVRAGLQESDQFTDLLQNIRVAVLDMHKHQRYPFEHIISDLHLSWDQSRHPLFDVVVMFQDGEMTRHYNIGELHISAYEKEQVQEGAKFDIVFNFLEKNGELELKLEYNSDIYSAAFARQLADHFQQLSDSIVVQKDVPVSQLDFLTTGEKIQLLESFNKTAHPYPADKTVMQLFEEQVQHTPGNTALVYQEQSFTYQQLNERANCFAHYLKTYGHLQRQEVAAILLDRTEWAIVAVLGVLKAGGIYLPIDPEYPIERVLYMQENSKCKVLIDENFIRKFEKNFPVGKVENPAMEISPEDPAYIIYTSGSTGKPKGVTITNKSLVNLCAWHISAFSVTAGDRATLYASFSFDAAIWELFPYIIAGASVHLLSGDLRMNVNELSDYYTTQQITIGFLPTQLGEKFIIQNSHLQQLRYLLLGGDKLNIFEKRPYRIVNNYGPTESTVVAASMEVRQYETNIPVGKPVFNTQLLVLNKHCQLCPIGVTGEIYIAGDSLAKGYFNNDAITAERFIAHPFKKGSVVYKTGDLGCWRSDGNLLFMGRIGQQMKIRGFRIEAGEIESALLSHPSISAAHIIARQDDTGEKELVAYFISGEKWTDEALRAYLNTQLPVFMLPAYYIQLGSFPTTQHGKIDLKALPDPVLAHGGKETILVAPRNKTEETLLHIWEQVLSRQNISVTDNFFSLGGHSLKASKMAGLLHKTFGVKIHLQEIFTHPVLEQLALLLQEKGTTVFSYIEPATYQESYPLSSSQHRIWTLSQTEAGNIAYNVPGTYLLEGELDVAALQRAFEKLAERHEVLRTVFKSNDALEIRQFIMAPGTLRIKIQYRDLREDPHWLHTLENLVATTLMHPFDLATGPLLRVSLFQTGNETHVIACTIHHIICDGWSMEIFNRELATCYNAIVSKRTELLPAPLRIQYKDFSVWQQEQLQSGAMEDHRQYWIKKLKGELPILNLPTDKARPLIKTYNGDAVVYQMNPDLYTRLTRLLREQDCTLFMGILAAVTALMHRYTGQEDIMLGTVTSGREHADLQDQLGNYINTLALSIHCHDEVSFRSLLNHVKQVSFDAYEHQRYPFNLLIDDLQLRVDRSRNPLFDVMVILQNMDRYNLENNMENGLSIKPFRQQADKSGKVDLSFICSEHGDGLQVELKYNTDIFERHTIDNITQHFNRLLQQLVVHPDAPLYQPELLLSAEKDLLMASFHESAPDYPRDQTIIQVFESQVIQSPENRALVFQDTAYTYRELNETANRLADFLQREHGVRTGDNVAISAERNAWSIICILGVLKAGGAYVPIDPAFPDQRISFILKDSGSRLFLDETELVRFRNAAHEYRADNVSHEATSQSLAYVIYTSGTTGQPKGVMITNQSLMDYAYGIRDKTNVSDCKDFGLVSTVAADLGNTIIYTSLLLGGTLHIYSITDATDAIKMRQEKLDCLKITPSHWKALQDDLPLFAPSQCLIFGGEPLTADIILQLQQQHATCQVYNHYGPTETTIGKLIRQFDLSRPVEYISLGWPIGNNHVFILDNHQQLLPEGATGEIGISGDGLAAGYMNLPELTARKFVPAPFLPGTLIYRTGDLGKRLADGSIRFLGRSDEMLKIRGYSVEPNEIANALQLYPDIEKAIVIPAESAQDEKELVAYLVTKSALQVQDIILFLKQRLPAYMIPANFIRIDSIPLTPNGKIDRSALPVPLYSGRLPGAEYVAPRNDIEQGLALIWQELLFVEKVSVKDDFFGLGGHSLKMTSLAGRIHQSFKVRIPLKDLFVNTTLESQATLIAGSDQRGFEHIKVQPLQAGYPLSSSQQRLWTLAQIEKSGTVYNMSRTWMLTGMLNTGIMEAAFRLMLDRHEILRTIFRHEATEGTVWQEVLSSAAAGFCLKTEDLRAAGLSGSALQQKVSEALLSPFDLERGPLLRAAIYRLEEGKWLFVYTMHHIISDGWSMNRLFNELLICYNALLAHTQPILPPLYIQYRDYAVWQREQLMNGALFKQEQYWLQQFSGEIPVLNMPVDKTRPYQKSYNGKTISRVIDPAVSKALEQLCHEEGTTLFAGLLTVLNILLFRYTTQRDIVIGTPIAGREHIDLENQIGFYINTLALRTRFTEEDSYISLLGKTTQVTVEANEHQAYPFEELVRKLNLKRDLSRSPLFDVMITLQYPEQEQLFKGIPELDIIPYSDNTAMGSKFDLTFYFIAGNNGLDLTLEFNSDIFLERTAYRLADHLQQLMQTLVLHPLEAVGKLSFLSPQEQQLILTTFNRPAVDFADSSTLVSLFEDQVSLSPEATALIFEDEKFTYRRLNEQANLLAAWLREQYQIQPDDLVAVQLEKSPEMIIALLGVLKSGAAYIPIGHDYPPDRISYMVADSQCKVLIDQELLSAISGQIALSDVSNPPRVNKPEDLAYVIYTSGSTGRPKGCMLEHRGVVNRLEWMWNAYGYSRRDIILQKTTFTFDVSVWEIFMPLCWGATMVLCQQEDIGSPERILELVEKHTVSCMHFVPSMFNSFIGVLDENTDLVKRLKSLRLLITSGEALSPELVKKWYAKAAAPVHNLYGPTEASVDVTAYTTAAGDVRIPIGKPISNISIYILDEAGQLAPVGVQGEICIAGVGVARGYLNNKELTLQRFSVDPFMPVNRMYRTGDMGRWLEDGNIEYIGRRDNQVKIHGYRIETGEIESALLTYPGLTASCVTDWVTPAGDKELVAYIAAAKALSVADLKQFLSGKLPSYMIPVLFIQLDQLPLTDSGKVNRKALPLPHEKLFVRQADHIAPRNPTEEQLLVIWKKILHRETISVMDSFFDLGGSSLTIISLSGLIHKNFEVKIQLRELFAHPVLEQQALLINAAARKSYTELQPVKERSSYPLSSAQRRLWILSQLEESSIAYNIPGYFHVSGELDIDSLNNAFRWMIARHGILRTVFREDEDGEIRQFILPEASVSFEVAYDDLRGAANQDPEAIIRQEAWQPFDLSTGLLLRAGLYHLSAGNWLFTCTMHHIISDGWSIGILISELLTVYRYLHERKQVVLPKLRIQYKDYTIWQQDQLKEGVVNASRDYWLRQFSGELPVLELPAAYARPIIKTYNGAVITRQISAATIVQLKALDNGKEYTLFMRLLAVINILLYRYTGQTDIITGSPVAGRDHADLEDQIGCYVNTIALRARFQGTHNYRELLEQIKHITLEAYEHAVYPFDELLEDLQLQRDMSRSPLFDVLIILNENIAATNLVIPGAVVKPYERAEHVVSKFDINFIFTEKGDDIQLTLEYNTDIYTESIAGSMCTHFMTLLEAIIQQPEMPIAALDYIPVAEKEQLIDMCKGPETYYPADATLIALFESQVAKMPDNTALIFEDVILTYTALNEAANQLAYYLRETFNIRPNDAIGVKLERSEQAVIAMLAVLKAGAGCVPIDPQYPEERIRYITGDSHCVVLIDDVLMQNFRKENKYPTINPPHMNTATDLAYVVYTSGSTGHPKGCMLHNRGVINHLWSKLELLQLTAEDTICHCSELYFVGGIWQQWAPLITGGKVVLCNYEELRDMEKLLEKTRAYQCRMLEVIASQISDYLSYGESIQLDHIQTLILTGERLSRSLVDKCYDGHPGLRIVNTYGQTECADVTSYYEVPRQCERMLVGRPIQHTRNYILSQEGQLCPVGVIGEVCTSGDGVCIGYANKPEQTASRFIPDPFRPGRMMYKTGDLGRWMPDGNLEVLGRIDNQIKIRGFRIEAGDIESALNTYEGISEARVLLSDSNTIEKSLTAYVVSKVPPDTAAVRAHLVKLLPLYMLPDRYVCVERIPLLQNGKVDKKELASYKALDQDTPALMEYPMDVMETKLADIWKSLLPSATIGPKSNFFESGGHSLKAARLSHLIHKAFEVKIALKEIFSHPLLTQQAQLIRKAGKTIYTGLLPTPVQNSYPLSSAQRRLWVLSQFKDGSRAYNMPGFYRISGELDIASLQAAFSVLISRYEILRTVFRENETGEIRQYVISENEAGFSLRQQDLSEFSPQEIATFLREEALRPFDLTKDILIRAGLHQLSANEWLLTCSLHHIITDGWSMGLLITALLTYYRSHRNGDGITAPALRLQYRDYASWQQGLLVGGALSASREYWIKQFSGELPVLELPSEKRRPAVKTYNGAAVTKIITADILRPTALLDSEECYTVFMKLLAALSALLNRYTGQEDIIIGTPVAGRDHADLEDQIGCYVNTLALRTRFDSTYSYRQLLAHIKTVTLEAYEHGAYPFDELIDDLGLKRDTSRSPLFDVMLVLQQPDNNPHIRQHHPGDPVIAAFENSPYLVSKFDLTFFFTAMDGEWQMIMEYNTEIYHHDSISLLGEHFIRILTSMVRQPDVPIQQINYLSEEEIVQLTVDFNHTTTAKDHVSSVLDLFEQQALEHPEQIALRYAGNDTTYGALNAQANQLAAWMLDRYAVKGNDLVAIRLERSDSMIAAILAVLKTGAAYIPVDPAYPAELVAYILNDSQCITCIDTATLTKFEEERHAWETHNISLKRAPGDLAYVMYTSGSTGKPKGCMVTNDNLLNYIQWALGYYFKEERPHFGLYTSLSFDLTVTSIYCPLTAGGMLYIYPQHEDLSDIFRHTFSKDGGINAIKLTPAHIGLLKHISLPPDGPVCAIVGGEEMTPEHVNILKNIRADIKIYNEYGPTEATVGCVVKELDGAGPVLIGKPIANTVIYILDDQQMLCPAGVTGEIYIGGRSVANGYLNREKLTKERFIADPIRTNGKLYKTGDLGKWLPDGNLAFIGRKDEQLKVQGYRIESGEVEAALQQCDGILAATVLARPDESGMKELVAWLVTENMPDVPHIREQLSNIIPAYMIPTKFYKLDKLPLTPNGKVDRKRLLTDEGVQIKTTLRYEPPANDVEEKLLMICREILGNDQIGVKDNFFDAGGNSIKLIRMVTQINRRFGSNLNVVDVFRRPAVSELAAYFQPGAEKGIEELNKEALASADILEETFRHLNSIDYGDE